MNKNKALAIALSAGLVLGGASVANAAESYDTEEAAKAAAQAELDKQAENYKGYDVSQGADGKYYFTLTSEKTGKEATVEEKTPDEDEEPEAPAEEEAKDGYDTKEEAEEAAKKALKNDKINKSFEVSQGLNGKWIYTLSPYEEINEEAPAEEEEKPEEDTKPEDKKKQTLDEWQIEQNEKDGYFTEEDARRAGELALEKTAKDGKPGLKGLYEVEVSMGANNMWFWRFVPVGEAKEEKPGTPLVPLTPAEEIKPGTPWTPIVPGETDKPGQDEDDKVVVPEEDEKDKDSKNKDSKDKEKESEEDKEKEDSKDKEKSKEKSKPAKTKGNNPKTGLAGLAPIYSTLAISMAGIVAARKKND